MVLPRRLSNPNYLHLFILLPPFFLLIFFSLYPFSNFTPITSFFTNLNPPTKYPNVYNATELIRLRKLKLKELNRSRIAVCLVGGARRFELTGPSIVKNVLNVYPNSDLYLHSPLDKDSFKFSFLKIVKRIVSIRIFKPIRLSETESQVRVLTASGSPNGIQGLLQYFNLVEGCLTMIRDHQTQNNFTYDWVVRTRVDSYWSAPLDPDNFVPDQYLVPPGSSFGGLNDRLGIGDFKTSTVALSRLSLIPQLDSFGYTRLNSESAFKAQLRIQGVEYSSNRLPFCIISDRKYAFPPAQYGVPVASLLSTGPLSGAKCRPCKPVCVGTCVANVMSNVNKGHEWPNWEKGSTQLCDAQGDWETGWEKIFDQAAGKKFATVRKHMKALSLRECIANFEEMKRRTNNWYSPSVIEICRLGLDPK
ncbi:hypothetical protein IFM89_030286 [Coptis chinensis]|uniref:DUF7796 domain-containing protein n=1 Tax=Coptis chinensis TaxID=261450 RepID=A0A835IRV0_9MAGN|nr:hypothetical protein IFM89_030286 [Coptis chinensis]